MIAVVAAVCALGILPALAFAEIDYTCLNDCSELGYISPDFCMQKCSIGVVHSNDQSETRTVHYQPARKRYTDADCLVDCVKRGNDDRFCKEHCR